MSGRPRIAVVGVGNMGEALVKGLLDRGLARPEDLSAAEKVPERARQVAGRYGIRVLPSVEEACREASVVVLAVKPQDVDPALAGIRAAGPALVVSVCAGVTLGQLERGLPQGTAVVRVMPNTPALVGEGVSVYCVNARVTSAHEDQVRRLLGALGPVHRVDREDLMDAVTGLSGSGPAYVFAFLEALADGGVLVGLPRPLARALALQTVLGAARLAAATGEHTAELKDRVASPGGTTIWGLRELERNGFRAAVIEAVRAATERSRQLGG